MTDLANTLWIEFRKVIRSRVPLFMALAFLILPLTVGFIMTILKDPEFARKAGLMTAKAQLTGGTADWPTYLGMLAQALSVGGIMLFSFIGSWVFGREFADGTLKDLLAVPVSRTTIVLAKFLVIALWSAALTVMIYVVGMVIGAMIGLPQGSLDVIVQGSIRLFITACLVIIVLMPVSLFANLGRGYLLPIGAAVLMLGIGNLIIVIGWGNYFPWSIPALFAGAVRGSNLEVASYVIVLLTGVLGVVGTYLYWKYADQDH